MFVLQSVSSLLVCISPQWVVCLYLTPVGVLVCISPQWVFLCVSHPSGCSCVYLTPVGVLVCISPQWMFLCVSHPSGCSCVYLTPVGVLVCISPQWVVCLFVSHPSGCSCMYLTPVGVLVCISPMQVMSVTACSCCWWRRCFQQSHAGTMSCIMGLFGWPPPSIPFPPPTPSVFCLCQYAGVQHSFLLCVVCIFSCLEMTTIPHLFFSLFSIFSFSV